MRVTAIDLVDLDGDLIELQVQWTGTPQTCGAPASFNQGNHIRALADTSHGGWLAGSVTLAPDGHAVPTRAALAVGRLVAEHDALRARLRVQPGGQVQQDIFGADQLAVAPAPSCQVTTNDIAELLDRRCTPTDTPGLFFGLLGGEMLIGIDHSHGDAITIELMLRRLVELYREPAAAPHTTRSYVERCRTEDRHRIERTGTYAPEIHTAGLAVWREFFAQVGGVIPDFPLPLGAPAATDEVPDSALQGKETRVVTLLDTEGAQALDASAPEGTFALVLAALADAIAAQGGPQTLATTIPVHTRGTQDSGWHATAGWQVTNAPVLVPAADPAAATTALRRALTAATVPLEVVLAACQPQLPPADVFMVSYLDYRKRGPALDGAQHISCAGRTDTTQWWFSRHHDGIDLRVRYPRHQVAEATVNGVVARLRANLVDPTTHAPHDRCAGILM